MNQLGHVSNTLWARRLKRPFDLLTAALLALALSPLLLLIALLIKLTSCGPVFFVQERSGLQGRAFRPLKFRTMRAERRPDVKELVPLAHPDITGIGRRLRRFKLDELPQLLNVIRGEMSLVGPRPTLPDQTQRYTEFQRQRLLVRPGLTGLAQVYSSAARPWNERILYDIAYVRRSSWALDLQILLRTPVTALLGEERTTQAFEASSFAACVTAPSAADMPDPVSG
ncbi:MAG: sugar transferase [Phycisphaerales bacterium]|nr:sugar transferase [Phycisphaerales bacterium]